MNSTRRILLNGATALVPGLAHDESHRHFLAVGVVRSDHRREPVHDGHDAVGPHGGDVAVREAVRVQGVRRFAGPVEVAEHHVRSAAQQVARGAGARGGNRDLLPAASIHQPAVHVGDGVTHRTDGHLRGVPRDEVDTGVVSVIP
jgi:hypothetical protein